MYRTVVAWVQKLHPEVISMAQGTPETCEMSQVAADRSRAKFRFAFNDVGPWGARTPLVTSHYS